ncbi:MAG: cell division protein ZapA [Nitrospiraceae bacterium]|jgi:cell division protein ZapA|nr:MAG: cell division protein ZapA [Nitrospiraceae bacterium]UCH45078.1 MAG: cell division protein ZapA [Nitrospiraceae bacterium]
MRSVEVQILGQSYSIRTDEDEAYIKSLARYIDDKLKEIYSAAPNVNQTKATVMAAFGIADELFKLRMEQQDLDRLIEEKTKILSGFLDS